MTQDINIEIFTVELLLLFDHDLWNISEVEVCLPWFAQEQYVEIHL